MRQKISLFDITSNAAVKRVFSVGKDTLSLFFKDCLNNDILHEGEEQSAHQSNLQTKRDGNTKFGLRVGVHQNFLEKLVLIS